MTFFYRPRRTIKQTTSSNAGRDPQDPNWVEGNPKYNVGAINSAIMTAEFELHKLIQKTGERDLTDPINQPSVDAIMEGLRREVGGAYDFEAPEVTDFDTVTITLAPNRKGL